MKRKIPKFKSIQEERAFWDTHSITDYFGELSPMDVEFPKPKHIIVGLEPKQMTSLKQIAFKEGISYSRLIKKWIIEKLAKRTVLSH